MKYIELTKGRRTIVDNADYNELKRYKWHFCNGYARRYDKELNFRYMHTQLLEPTAPLQVDHINWDKLDNRRENLRVVSEGDNKRNVPTRSKWGHKGITLTRGGRFQASYWYEGKSRHIGIYDSVEEAGCAYDTYLEQSGITQ